MSIEDELFLDLMDRVVYMDEANCWVAPLPFRPNRPRLPNNIRHAKNRLMSLCRMLEKKQGMKEHFFKFMQSMFDSDQAEPAPALTSQQECWYLPIFGVYHPQKKDQIRVVFDSSAKHEGLSLNDVLLRGPDMNNTLLGVLMRFRKEPIAVTADIQQMFYCFIVQEEHRDFLRFLWFEDNNPSKQITEYRMKVHVFGNSPSPAVAIYGLRKAALHGEKEHGSEPKQFIMRNFYVDNGLSSFPTEDEAISVLKRTQKMLAESSIKLHKIASNSRAVMDAFPPEERAKNLVNLELTIDPLPLQRSLGLTWNLQSDTFAFCVSREQKPFTRRGILSTVNGLYDPLGYVSPVTIQGKALVRELSAEQAEWDDPLPALKEEQWRRWTDSLCELEQLQRDRTYVPISLRSARHRELCVFSDASTMAISAVAYLKATDMEGNSHVGFLMEECKCLSRGDVIPKSSPLRKLNPFVDADGLLRVGGRISLADIPWEEKHPIIVPKKHHIATLLTEAAHGHSTLPHSSHMGGVWERMIGVARRILDALLLLKKKALHLTHEVLVTLMSEVMAIMNARPLVPVSF
ncbi:hypothetical protein NFI96_015842 [Prochilodus magdalenae]|nr:hypothetical protein NFI96_015842 [Prochilodus magdalenae]